MSTPPPEDLRQLLENAAKALTGIQFAQFDGWQRAWFHTWQPQLPGLDSQVLAAELGIDTDWRGNYVKCSLDGNFTEEDYIDHPSKAHAQAMAVLRVAAAIGEAI